MGRELSRLTFGVVTHDPEHWDPAELAAAADAEDYHDHAVDQLRAAMLAAGLAHIAAHPTVYDPDLY